MGQKTLEINGSFRNFIKNNNQKSLKAPMKWYCFTQQCASDKYITFGTHHDCNHPVLNSVTPEIGLDIGCYISPSCSWLKLPCLLQMVWHPPNPEGESIPLLWQATAFLHSQKRHVERVLPPLQHCFWKKTIWIKPQSASHQDRSHLCLNKNTLDIQRAYAQPPHCLV